MPEAEHYPRLALLMRDLFSYMMATDNYYLYLATLAARGACPKLNPPRLDGVKLAFGLGATKPC